MTEIVRLFMDGGTLPAMEEMRNAARLVILCEPDSGMDGQAAKRQEFHGVKLACKLRLDGCKAPMLFVSFLSRQQLGGLSTGTEVINAVGSGFKRLPATDAEMEAAVTSINSLSDLELRDVQLFSCRPDGVASAKVHELVGITDMLQRGTLDGLQVKGRLSACLREMHSLFGTDGSVAAAEFARSFNTVNIGNVREALAYVKAVSDRLALDYMASGHPSDILAPISTERPWQLLLLDDELTEDSGLVKMLEKAGVQVICTSIVEGAINALKADKSIRGRISVILADYRLYEKKDGINVQQPLQGYAFLQEVSRTFQSRILSSVVYSGMPRKFLMDSFGSIRMKTEFFSKIDYPPTEERALKVLVSHIVETGDHNHEQMLALPIGNAGWAKHLHEWYLKFRLQPDYLAREKDICEACTEWVRAFKAGERPPTPMIKGDSFNAKRDEEEQDTLKRFMSYYKTRRLAQYLTLSLGRKESDPRKRICGILGFANKKYEKESAIKGFFSQILGLRIEETPFGATMEDLCWLHHDVGLPVLDGYRQFRRLMIDTERLAGELIAELEGLRDHINGLGSRFELVIESDSWRPVLFDKLDIGLLFDLFDGYFEGITVSREDLERYQTFLDEYKRLWNPKM